MWMLGTSKITYVFNTDQGKKLKLTKGMKWWHNNIVLKSEKIKFTKTLKSSVQSGEEIDGTKGQNKYRTIKQTLNIKRLAYQNWQTSHFFSIFY